MLTKPSRRAVNRTGHHQTKYGHVEVFWANKATINRWSEEVSGEHSCHEAAAIQDAGPGWYYWACSPGCLPDGDPIGPFDTSDAAYEDAGGEP